MRIRTHLDTLPTVTRLHHPTLQKENKCRKITWNNSRRNKWPSCFSSVPNICSRQPEAFSRHSASRNAKVSLRCVIISVGSRATNDWLALPLLIQHRSVHKQAGKLGTDVNTHQLEVGGREGDKKREQKKRKENWGRSALRERRERWESLCLSYRSHTRSHNTSTPIHTKLLWLSSGNVEFVETLGTRYSNGLEACVCEWMCECEFKNTPRQQRRWNLTMHHLKDSPSPLFILIPLPSLHWMHSKT